MTEENESSRCRWSRVESMWNYKKRMKRKENRLTRQEIGKKGRNKLKMFRRKEVDRKKFKGVA